MLLSCDASSLNIVSFLISQNLLSFTINLHLFSPEPRLPLCNQREDARGNRQWRLHWKCRVFRKHVWNQVSLISVLYSDLRITCWVTWVTRLDLEEKYVLVWLSYKTMWMLIKLVVMTSFCSKSSIEDVQAQNLICILDVDIQGVNNIKKTDLNPIYISIQPPSIEILVSRWSHDSLNWMNLLRFYLKTTIKILLNLPLLYLGPLSWLTAWVSDL